MRRLHTANLRAAWWALRTARHTRRLLAAEGLDAALGPPPPPRLPAEAERGAKAVLRRRGESCLVTAIVLQAWEAAHGRRRDLIVGVTSSSQFRAHAWLEGDPMPPAESLPDLGLSQLRVTGELESAIVRSGEQEAADPARPRFHELLRRPAPSSR